MRGHPSLMPKAAKRIVIGLIFCALAVFALVQVRQAGEKQAKAASKPSRGPSGGARTVTVSLTQATTGSVRDDVEISGSLKPKEQVDVSPKVTGRVEQLNVQVGDFVKQGQLIAVLDAGELAQQVRRAEAAQSVVRATLDQRRAELSNAKADLDRARQLLDSGLIARQDYESKATGFRVMQSQVALTESQIEQAAAELSELRIRLSQTRIPSPISGLVAQKFVDTGAVVSPTTPIVRVVNVSTLVTVANVPERQVGQLRRGARALVHVDALGERAFEGRVARIAPVLDPATRTAQVEVEIPNPAGALRAEMFARVRLDLGMVREAVLIPRDALVYRGRQSGVYVVYSKKPSFRPVETGATEGQQIEVTGSLAPGTTIVHRGAAMLSEGDQIRIVGEDEAGKAAAEKGGL